jgi:hypothetical protein
MGLDLWFRDDVARLLASTQEAIQASIRAARAAHAPGSGDPTGDRGQSQSQDWGQSQSQDWGQSQSQDWGQSQSRDWLGASQLLSAYQQGVEDTLRAVGLAFGLAVEGRLDGQRWAGPSQVVDGDLVARPLPPGNARGRR